MNITLDHNCIINLEKCTLPYEDIEAIIKNPDNQCFVVNIGASEMREKGVRPEHYEQFEKLLATARIKHLPRLNPMLILDVTFVGRSVLASNEMIRFAQEIESALFPNGQLINTGKVPHDQKAYKKWLNRICDIHTMWCHIQNRNDVFLTSDENFMKPPKKKKLLALGAREIHSPQSYVSRS